MNRERNLRLTRLAALQADIRERATQAAETERANLRQLEEDEVAIVNALGGNSALHGVLIGLVASASERIAADKAKSAHAFEAAQKRAAREQIRERIVKERALEARRAVKHRRERELLLDLILTPRDDGI